VLPKIAQLRAWIDERGLDVVLEVDGGVAPGTIGPAARAGADAFVAGSSVYGAPDYRAAIEALRRKAEEARERASGLGPRALSDRRIGLPGRAGQPALRASLSACFTLRPSTIRIASSAMLVAWSATRSRFLATWIRSTSCEERVGSSWMRASALRITSSCSSSTCWS